ncbi:MAG: response regulator [Verrucomicrobiota bacterium]
MDDLRKRAEERATMTDTEISGMSAKEIRDLVHELQVHQIELEIQNEALRATQTELAETRDRFADLYDFAPVGYVTLDADHVLRETNSTICSMLGVDRSTLLGNQLAEWVDPEHRDACSRHIRSIVTSRTEQSFETQFLCSDGSRIWALVRCVPNGETSRWPEGCRGTITDITDRKRAEADLQRSEAIYRKLAEVNLFGVGFGDAHGNLTFVNDEMLRMMGCTRQDFEMGRINWRESLAPDCGEEGERSWFQRLFEDGQIVGYEREFLRPDGGRTPYIGAAAVIDGGTAFLVFIALDTSAIKAAQRKLEAFNETLEQRVVERTNKLRALAAQLTDAEEQERQRLAHLLHDDLQQQLAALKITLNGVIPPDKRDADTARRMEEFKNYIDDAIQQTRTLSLELSPPALRLHGICSALEWLADHMREEHGLDVEVEADPEAEPRIHPWKAILFQAAKELLYNVVKHSGQSSARLELKRIDGHVQLSVCDEGVGIDPETMRQKHESLDSFGLLSIEERLQYMGGRVVMSGGPGQGCCVCLILPLEAPEEPTLPPEREEDGDTEAAPAEEETHNAATLRVLVADDHDLVRESLAALLEEEENIAVVAKASDGRETIRLAQAVRPDVVLMDVSMPELDGIQAATAIRAELPEIRIVGLSMHSDSKTETRMLNAGAEAFLPKDASPEELVAVIRNACPAQQEPPNS